MFEFMDDTRVSDILRNTRIEKKFLMKDIAKATHTSVTYICKLEKGGYLPSPKFLIAFCNKTGLPYKPMVGLIINERKDSLEETLKSRYFDSRL